MGESALERVLDKRNSLLARQKELTAEHEAVEAEVRSLDGLMNEAAEGVLLKLTPPKVPMKKVKALGKGGNTLFEGTVALLRKNGEAMTAPAMLSQLKRAGYFRNTEFGEQTLNGLLRRHTRVFKKIRATDEMRGDSHCVFAWALRKS